MNMMPYIYVWVVFVVAVAGLAIDRHLVARHGDETLRLADKEVALLAREASVSRKLRRIDFWGQWLTVVAVLYGIALLDIYFHSVWPAGAKPPL